MVLSNLVTYCVILATGATLFRARHRHIATAAEAAQELVPLAGREAGALLAVGLVATWLVP
jgi:hypothetical protein